MKVWDGEMEVEVEVEVEMKTGARRLMRKIFLWKGSGFSLEVLRISLLIDENECTEYVARYVLIISYFSYVFWKEPIYENWAVM